MRACEESNHLLEVIKSDKITSEKMQGDRWEVYRTDDYSLLKDMLKDSNEYFLGIREDYLNIYYKGMSMAKVVSYYNRACKYYTSYYYAQGIPGYENVKKGKQVALSPKEFWDTDNQKNLREQIENHVFGKHDNKTRLEKVCQQWVINMNNSNPNSEWYYVDMEYVYKGKEEVKAHPFGRADLIAIKRKPNEKGKHEVSFIELKVGNKSYSGEEDNPQKMEALKKSLYSIDSIDIKLGSGLASHMVDFIHFFSENFYLEQVKREILGMLKWHKEFGLITPESELGKLQNEANIEDKPDIYIVTYTGAPQEIIIDLSEKEKEKYSPCDYRNLKMSFFKYMYKSRMAFVDIVNHDEIQGIFSLKEKFTDFINDDDELQISCLQSLNGKDYRFIFRFIDVNDDRIPNECCI